MTHALITIPIENLDRANAAALQFGTGVNFTLLAYAANAPTDTAPVGSYCAAHFNELVLAAVTALIASDFPGATITPYQLAVDPCPLSNMFNQLGWRMRLTQLP